ncbi:hypothetical protein [Streptomyces sp. NPDC059788]|uniref:hypothetical protein n=1 Tax=Streptomyces sp. NPDC059788 TaxID=3346948 RepID=UPI003667AF4E
MTDDSERRYSGVERTVSLVMLGGLGVVLGLCVRDQSFVASILWGLAGGIAAAPIIMGATRLARYVAKRRSARRPNRDRATPHARTSRCQEWTGPGWRPGVNPASFMKDRAITFVEWMR